MEFVERMARVVIVMLAAATAVGCAEAKVGFGPFKAMAVEVGPGGVEAKGPGVGPFGVKVED